MAKRYRPKLQFNNLWTYNLFRIWEQIFGRRVGIRAEASKDFETGTVYCYTLEATIVNLEVMLRNMFSVPKFSIVKVPILQFASIGNTTKQPLGYRFAIALDTSGTLATLGPGTSVTNAYTVTGSNPAICVAWNGENQASKSLTTITYAGTTMNNPGGSELNFTNPSAGFDRWRRITYLLGCATGGNNIVVNYGASFPVYNGYASSYSGVDSAGSVGTSTAGSASASSLTVTVSVPTANSWLVGYAASDANNVAAGTGATARGDTDGTTPRHLYDSNGAVGSGNQSMTATQTATGFSWMAVSIPPAGGGTVATNFLSLLGVGT